MAWNRRGTALAKMGHLSAAAELHRKNLQAKDWLGAVSCGGHAGWWKMGRYGWIWSTNLTNLANWTNLTNSANQRTN